METVTFKHDRLSFLSKVCNTFVGAFDFQNAFHTFLSLTGFRIIMGFFLFLNKIVFREHACCVNAAKGGRGRGVMVG